MPDTTSIEDLEEFVSEQIDKASEKYEEAIKRLKADAESESAVKQ